MVPPGIDFNLIFSISYLAETISSEPLRLLLNGCIKIIYICAEKTIKSLVGCHFLTLFSIWRWYMKTINVYEDLQNLKLFIDLYFVIGENAAAGPELYLRSQITLIVSSLIWHMEISSKILLSISSNVAKCYVWTT